MHRNLSRDIGAETSQQLARWHKYTWTHVFQRQMYHNKRTHKTPETHTDIHTSMSRFTKWLTLLRTHSWCSRWLAITRTRTPSVNSHRLWCYYTLSSQRGSTISPLMTMIHSVWSDNSIYTPASDGEWKSERMIAAHVGATASMPTQSCHNTHTHTHTQTLLEYHDCPYTLLCCPSVRCPLPALSLSRLQSCMQSLGLHST